MPPTISVLLDEKGAEVAEEVLKIKFNLNMFDKKEEVIELNLNLSIQHLINPAAQVGPYNIGSTLVLT